MTILHHPTINRAPAHIEKLMQRALEIESFLKQEGTTITRQGSFVVIEFKQEIAAEEFEKVMKRGGRS